ncbi:MAG: hypothetical protein LBH95_00160 [Oscillospiraceae bacterium]|jgi:hypothetical protein|nr:hypothetical protein [Oscillospiraceae bacterium]
MAQPSKGKNSHDPRLRHLNAKTVNAASATDFTGLIPANPQTPTEPYEELRDFGEETAKKAKR